MQKPAPVQELVERVVLALPRRRLRQATKKKLAAADYAFKQIRITRETAAKYNVTDVVTIYDAAQFCVMAIADIAIITRDMCCASDWWQSHFYARLAALTIIECIDDIPTVLGKGFREALQATGLDEVHVKNIGAITKRLSDFRKLHGSDLRKIRDIAAAHRDHDVNAQIQIIESLDIRKLTQLAIELDDVFQSLSHAIAATFSSINVPREVIKSFLKKPWSTPSPG